MSADHLIPVIRELRESRCECQVSDRWRSTGQSGSCGTGGHVHCIIHCGVSGNCVLRNKEDSSAASDANGFSAKR